MVAAIMIGTPMHLMGIMVMGPAALVGSESVWVGWAVHIAAGILFAARYGLAAHTRAYGKGLLYGANLWSDCRHRLCLVRPLQHPRHAGLQH